MRKDPILEELRKLRDRHAAKFNYDVDAIVRDLQRGEKASRRKLYSFRPRKPQKV